MADEDRNPDGRAADPQLGQVQDLAALGDDLPLLPRVAVVEEDVDLGQGVEGNLVGIDRRVDRLCPRRGRRPAPRARPARRRPCPTPTGRCRRPPARSRPGRAGPSGSATSCIVEQFGLAMIPAWPAASSGLTWLTTSGTAGSIRQAFELSMTVGPGRDGRRCELLRGGAASREQGDVDPGECLRRGFDHGVGRATDRRSSGRPSAPTPSAEAGRSGSRARGGPGSSSARRGRWRRRRRR